jgi:hypothetical protein
MTVPNQREFQNGKNSVETNNNGAESVSDVPAPVSIKARP